MDLETWLEEAMVQLGATYLWWFSQDVEFKEVVSTRKGQVSVERLCFKFFLDKQHV